jgi:hypothetical protein
VIGFLDIKHQGEIVALTAAGSSEVWSASNEVIVAWEMSGKYVKDCLLEVGANIWAGGSGNVITIFDSKTREEKTALKHHKSPVISMILVYNSHVWSIAQDRDICIWS